VPTFDVPRSPRRSQITTTDDALLVELQALAVRSAHLVELQEPMALADEGERAALTLPSAATSPQVRETALANFVGIGRVEWTYASLRIGVVLGDHPPDPLHSIEDFCPPDPGEPECRHLNVDT
jgi:hypothetical protein